MRTTGHPTMPSSASSAECQRRRRLRAHPQAVQGPSLTPRPARMLARPATSLAGICQPRPAPPHRGVVSRARSGLTPAAPVCAGTRLLGIAPGARAGGTEGAQVPIAEMEGVQVRAPSFVQSAQSQRRRAPLRRRPMDAGRAACCAALLARAAARQRTPCALQRPQRAQRCILPAAAHVDGCARCAVNV